MLADGQTDRQTDKHTETLIVILRPRTDGRVNIFIFQFYYRTLLSYVLALDRVFCLNCCACQLV